MNKEYMSSRQRVLNAIEHKPVDRMPIDLGVHFSTGISAYAYYELRKYLGLSVDQIEMIDCSQGLARVDQDILDRFHIDTMLLNPPWENTHKWNPRGTYEFLVPDSFRPVRQSDGGYRMSSGQGEIYMPAGGYFFDGICPDFYGFKSEEEKWELFGRRAEEIYKETDKFTMVMGYGAFFHGLEFACEMLLDPESCKYQNETQLGKNIAKFDRMNKRFGKYIQAIEVNSDLGMQNAPMCSPESYEECCLPYLKAFCKHVHENSDIKIFLHSCGSIDALLPDIIEAGVDIVNPVQISADNMDPGHLKRTYGDSICFWGGGCDTQRMLWQGTPEEVSAHVEKNIEIFAKGSGFVFNQVHNIMGNVPPANIAAMLDTAYECAVRDPAGVKTV